MLKPSDLRSTDVALPQPLERPRGQGALTSCYTPDHSTCLCRRKVISNDHSLTSYKGSIPVIYIKRSGFPSCPLTFFLIQHTGM